MAALFGMHSFGTGFLVQSLLALRLYQAFAISVTTAAAILFRSSICSAISCLVAVPIAARIGLINTMVFTDLPFQHPADPDPVHHRSDDSDRLVVRSQRAVANGRADSQLLCHGVITPQQRPAAASVTAVPKTSAWPAGSMILGLSADIVHPRLAVADRRDGKGDLRHIAPDQVPKGAPPPEEVAAPTG
jgi:hypothetical protein